LTAFSSRFFKVFTRRQKEDSNFLLKISCEMSNLSRLFSRRTNFISLELNHNENNTKNIQDIIEKLFLIKYDLISNRLKWKIYLHFVFDDQKIIDIIKNIKILHEEQEFMNFQRYKWFFFVIILFHFQMIMIHLIQITHYDSKRVISITFSLRFDRFKLRFVTKFFDRKKICFEKETRKFHVFEKLIIHIFKAFLITMFWIVLEKNINSNSFVSFETIDLKNTFEKYLNIRLFADIRRLIHETWVRFFEDKTHLNKNDDLRNRMFFIQQMKTYMLLKYVISHANLTFIIYVFSRIIMLFHDFNKYKYNFEMLYMF
jgi:hypothetical protein